MKAIEKFEHPGRLKEINIEEALKKAGINETSRICDYGAGTGVFSVAAASMTKNNVYALDMSPEMIGLIKDKKTNAGFDHIIPLIIEADDLPLDQGSIDIFLLVTVFHHIDNAASFVDKIYDVLDQKSKLIIIEFIKKDSPMGPPIGHRMSQSEVKEIIGDRFNCIHDEVLGDNLYLQIYESV